MKERSDRRGYPTRIPIVHTPTPQVLRHVAKY
jgi:hypothetical protein